jgi:superfamily II DNA or RNA helicase
VTTSFRFERGTLVLSGALATSLPGVVWDPRTRSHRATAHRYRSLRALAHRLGDLDDAIPARWSATRWSSPELRPYQRDALAAWIAHGKRGTIVLPTGAGKTRVALAAAALVRGPTVVVVPTRVLLEQWVAALRGVFDGRIGVLGDGEQRIEDVTVMTFESAFRYMDVLGDRFALLVVDEVHHFGSGAREEALVACVAPYRLGLTATAPEAGTTQERALVDLVGPVVFSMSIVDLAGSHLAHFDVVRMRVALTVEERATYATLTREFVRARERIAREGPVPSWDLLLRRIAQLPGGRKAVADWHRAVALAAFPADKRALARSLIQRHRDDKTLVFAMHAADAYAIARDNLVPAITSEIGREERKAILESFREGRVRCVVSARVLNEGVDVPDARVAILLGGALGVREQIQRIGRVLRPSPGKRAVIYDVATRGTMDERRSDNKWRKLAR